MITFILGSDNWLQLCEISVSPVGDLIVIANGRKIVSLSSKWNNPINEFEITHSGTIHDYDEVKAVLALPIVEENQNSNIGPDWTCILVAFDSGYVRFYTENCQLLFEKQFHNENITSVKCQSQHGPNADISLNLQPEEIYIQYKSSLVVLSGIQLVQHLRRCRNQILKGSYIFSSIKNLLLFLMNESPLNILSIQAQYTICIIFHYHLLL